MHSGRSLLTSLLLASALSVPVITTACAHHYYRSYDPGYGDYHTWNSNENVYYQQWETQNHYDHRDFKDRDKDQQKQYYDWRHQHEHDNDHHDNDHHDNNNH
jgi:hypothetical protein